MRAFEISTFKNGYLSYIQRRYSQKVARAKWKSVVGLEIHAQINSSSKLFSGAPNEFASPVNNNVAMFDASTPGTLPVLNIQCVEAGVLTALALNCRINPISMFDRKHYFYADMPAGYQITQQRSPLAGKGYLEFQVFTPGFHNKPYKTKANIKQIQLEQDSGKSLHEDERSLVDLNRAGAPLMELVFEPDLQDGEEAAALVKELVVILQRIGTCTCKMEEGALRVDANISVHKPGEPLGTRTEVKNIGSVRGVAGAIKYEIERQIKLLENGGTVTNETRAWDADHKTTLAMRDKEQQQDYRYMPEPNLPPLHIALGPVETGCVSVVKLREQIPELPEQTRTRLREEFGLSSEQSIILVNEPKLLDIFENAIRGRSLDYKLAANLLINDFLTVINKENKNLNEIDTTGEVIGDIVDLIMKETITRNTAKLLLNEIVIGNKDDPIKIVEKNNWKLLNNDAEIQQVCMEVISNNPKIVRQYKDGKVKVFKALLGQVAQRTESQINMAKVVDIMKDLLNKKS